MHIVKGKRAVMEALQASVPVDRLVVAQGFDKKPDIQTLLKIAGSRRISIETLSMNAFERVASDSHHQGIMAYVHEKQQITLDTLLENPEEYPMVIVLDHLEDPYNFGAILRTCDAFGLKAVLYPKDRNSQISPGVIKASSGAVYHLDLIKVVNVAQTIQKLKTAGYWIYGTDVQKGVALHDFKPVFPLALVVGNESSGQSRLVSKLVDANLHIPMHGQLGSLNVSVATGILAYTISQAYARL